MIPLGVVAAAGGGGPPSPYYAPAVQFDGDTYLSIVALLSTDNAYWSFAGWFKPDSAEGTTNTLVAADPDDIGSLILRVQMDVDGGVFATQPIQYGGDQIFYLNAAAPPPSVGAWTHILVSVDTSYDNGDGTYGRSKIYLNGEPVSFTVEVEASSPFDMLTNGLPFAVGSNTLEEHYRILGAASDWWVAPGVLLLDETGEIPEATIRKFISAEGKPVNPSGFPTSAMLFSGDADTFGENQGTGGEFTVTGALTNANTSPSD